MAASLGTQRGALERQIHAAEAANDALEAQLVRQHEEIAGNLARLAGEVETAKARYETSIRTAEEACASLKGALEARFDIAKRTLDDLENEAKAIQKALHPIKRRLKKFIDAWELIVAHPFMGSELGRLNEAKALLR